MGNCLAKNDGTSTNMRPDIRTSQIDMSWPDDFEDIGPANLPDVVVENDKLTLNLSFLKLKSLPAQVCERRTIEVLNLNCNKISTFPYQFAALRSLKELHLGNNHLEFLPAQVCTSVKLEVLELNRNLIETLPYCVSHLCNLRRLNLAFNNIRSLPPSMHYLKYLEYLNMEGNGLENIPEAVFTLCSLKVLVLSDNDIESIPTSLDKLVHLKELYLDDNRLSDLPAALLQFLSELEILNVSNNAKLLTLCKSEKPKKQAKQKLNNVDPKAITEVQKSFPIPQEFKTPVAEDRSMIFSEINLNHPEEGRDIFEGEQGLCCLNNED